jgi:hypothetical protein
VNEDLELVTPALEAARRRRIRLHDELVELEQALSTPAPGRVKEWTVAVADALRKLREAFDEHVFVTEKQDGLYEEIMVKSPRLAGKIKRLEDEHPLVLADVDDTIRRLDQMETETDWPPETARDDIGRLIQRITRHRQRGADLVWEAYNVDIGGME